jgi:hypothetical protein
LARKSRNEYKTDLGLAVFGKFVEEQGKGEFRAEIYYSLSTPLGMESQKYSLGGEITMVRERASIIALDFLRKYLLKVRQGA